MATSVSQPGNVSPTHTPRLDKKHGFLHHIREIQHDRRNYEEEWRLEKQKRLEKLGKSSEGKANESQKDQSDDGKNKRATNESEKEFWDHGGWERLQSEEKGNRGKNHPARRKSSPQRGARGSSRGNPTRRLSEGDRRSTPEKVPIRSATPPVISRSKKPDQAIYSPPRGKYSSALKELDLKEEEEAEEGEEEGEKEELPIAKKRLLLVLSIEVRKGHSESLEVYEDSNALEISRTFCEKHSMDSKLVDVIREQIETNVKRLQDHH